MDPLLTNLPALNKDQSITEQYCPQYRKLSGLKSEPRSLKYPITIQEIRDEYSQVSSIIDHLEQAFDNRMGVHERELIAIMKNEIYKMLDDVRKVVKVFNAMIKEKNFSQDLWETRNELEYFKFEAFRLFEDNKRLRAYIASQKKQIQSLKFQQQCQSIALQRITKKLVKQKAMRNTQCGEFDQYSSLSPIKTRKRHESLHNTSCKSTNVLKDHLKGTPGSPQTGSTQLQKEKKERMRTEKDLDITQFQLRGHSERINLIGNGHITGKLKCLKNKVTMCKQKFKERQKNEDEQKHIQ